MKIQVFIENEAGSDQKNLFNEKTLEYKKTVTVSRKYPYPYGFIINTTSGDGDNLDCFVITAQKLKSRDTVEVEAVGTMEQFEDGKEDHNILAVFKDENVDITDEIKKELTEFVANVFNHRQDKTVEVRNFYGGEEANKLIEVSRRV